jgi:hypothetical protein
MSVFYGRIVGTVVEVPTAQKPQSGSPAHLKQEFLLDGLQREIDSSDRAGVDHDDASSVSVNNLTLLAVYPNIEQIGPYPPPVYVIACAQI